MPHQINVFISSPSDVGYEREVIKNILYDLNLHLAKYLNLEIKPLLWEDITSGPGLAQKLILEEFPLKTWDIFIGILGNRFGTSTGMMNPTTGKSYESGTVQEFEQAYKSWKENKRPKILFYRCMGTDESVGDDGQRQQVEKFFKEVQENHPILYQCYEMLADFGAGKKNGRHSNRRNFGLGMSLLGKKCLSIRCSTGPDGIPLDQSVNQSGRFPDFTRLVRRDLDAKLLEIAAPPSMDILTKPTKVGLQAVIDDFWWTFNGEEKPRELEVKVTMSSQFIMSTQQKDFYLKRWETDPDAEINKGNLRKDLKIHGRNRIQCPDWPLRYVSGGVLPIVEIDSKEYYLLFYRIKNPVGWNLANGGAIDARELWNPRLTIRRKFGAEVLAADVEASPKAVFIYDPSSSDSQFGYQKTVIQELWPTSSQPQRMRIKEWQGGPDTVRVAVYDNEFNPVDNVFVSITPEDNGVEVDRVVVIEGTKEMRFVDGDVSQSHPIGRLVGLFCREEFNFDNENFIPDVLFYGNHKVESPSRDDFNDQLDRYLRATKTKGQNASAYPAKLCPITKELIRRYTSALKNGQVKILDPSGDDSV